MVVIGGQPFYKSTGENSGLPGTWFPFIMLCASQFHHKFQSVIQYPKEMQHKMEKEIEERFQSRFGMPVRESGGQPYYTTDLFFFNQHREYEYYKKVEPYGGLLIKADSGVINPEEIDLDFHRLNAIFEEVIGNDYGNHRICRKIDLIVSMRLGGGVWENLVIKTKALDLLTNNEKELTNITVELDNHILCKDDPDEINNWLIEQGATMLQELCNINMTMR